MNKWRTALIIGLTVAVCHAGDPFRPRRGSASFMVYFASQYRGLCMGSLVSRTTVMTASVCVLHPYVQVPDRRPVTVVTGTDYRHPHRGIRVQVAKILVPKLTDNIGERTRKIQMSPSFLLLYRKVPDALAEVPLRSINVDFTGEEVLSLHEECMTVGWHYFFKGDKIFPGNKFLLQRNLRVQFINIAKEILWCNTIKLKFEKALSNLGYTGNPDVDATVCMRDTGSAEVKLARAGSARAYLLVIPTFMLSAVTRRELQHGAGMYGAPLLCRGRVVAVMTAPDAQWLNCTGYTNLMHLLSASHLREYMSCLSSLFAPDLTLNWATMKKNILSDDNDQPDYFSDLYDKIISGSSSVEKR